MAERLSYQESCRELQAQKLIDQGEIPPMPERAPRHDDEEPLGVSFFRTLLTDAVLEGLALPRTFFCRSGIQSVSFRNTDLSESVANWNDFMNSDFSGADLSNTDLRGCAFEGVNFTGTCLENADLRHSTFKGCDFTDAIMRGVKITKEAASQLGLSGEQMDSMDWQADDGDEPEGG